MSRILVLIKWRRLRAHRCSILKLWYLNVRIDIAKIMLEMNFTIIIITFHHWQLICWHHGNPWDFITRRTSRVGPLCGALGCRLNIPYLLGVYFTKTRDRRILVYRSLVRVWSACVNFRCWHRLEIFIDRSTATSPGEKPARNSTKREERQREKDEIVRRWSVNMTLKFLTSEWMSGRMSAAAADGIYWKHSQASEAEVAGAVHSSKVQNSSSAGSTRGMLWFCWTHPFFVSACKWNEMRWYNKKIHTRERWEKGPRMRRGIKCFMIPCESVLIEMTEASELDFYDIYPRASSSHHSLTVH